ncbi:MAG: hypothetical protein ACLFS9_09800 [Nitriliruptoraceae bacterium]
MEFLIYTLAAIAAAIVLFKPQRERLAFGVFSASVLIAVGMFVIATSTSYLPIVNV